MPTPRIFVLVAASVLGPANMILAQQPDSTHLLPVVVTATREPTPANVTSQPVTVLTGEQLRAQGLTTVADALRQVPATSVAQTGSFGGVTSLFLRGGESRYTKVLVDGVPMNTVGGTVFLQNLTLDNVDRIEIVGGPASALYGADAMTGVVQIFTRRGTGRGADVFAGGGTYGTADLGGSVRGGTPDANLSVGGGWHRTNGVDAYNNEYSNGTLSAAGMLRPAAGTAFSVTSRYTDALYHFPTDYAGVINDPIAQTHERRLIGGLDASQEVGARVTLHLLGGVNDVRGLSVARTDGPSRDTNHDTRATAEARGELRLPAATIVTVGMPYESELETLRSESGGGKSFSVTTSRDHRETRGVYAAAQSEPTTRFAYDASARYDSHSDYHGVATYHAGASVAVWPGARARVAYGTAFNAPAFYETLGSAYNHPNRDLQPEQAHSIDGGVQQSLFAGRLRLDAGVFDQRFSDVIQYVPGTAYLGSPGMYVNLTRARSLGYTGGVHIAPVAGLDVVASYAQTIARVTETAPGVTAKVGDALLRRPSHTGAGSVAYARDGWAGAVTVSYVGQRPDEDFQRYTTVQLPAYTRMDVSAAIPAVRYRGATVALTARAANVLDRRYDEIANFPAPGRTILVGARIATAP